MPSLRDSAREAKRHDEEIREQARRDAEREAKKKRAAWHAADRYKYTLQDVFGDDGDWEVTSSSESGQTLVDRETGLRIQVTTTGESVPDYGYVTTDEVFAADVPAGLSQDRVTWNTLRLRSLVDAARAFEWLDKHKPKDD